MNLRKVIIKKIFTKCALMLIILMLFGCMSESKKIKVLKEELDTKYGNYNMLDNCGYWNEGGDDELYSIVKVDEKYMMISSSYRNEQISYYDNLELLNISLFDNNIIVAETEFFSDENNLIIIFDKNYYTYDTISNKIKEIVLEYGKNKSNIDEIRVLIYYSSSIINNIDFYKEFAISQSAGGSCDYNFYKKYKSKINILNDFESYKFWIQTEKYYNDSSLNYRQYINNEVDIKLNVLKY